MGSCLGLWLGLAGHQAKVEADARVFGEVLYLVKVRVRVEIRVG